MKGKVKSLRFSYRFLKFLERNRWLLVGILGTVSFITGLLGHHFEMGKPWTDALYSSICQFTFEMQNIRSDTNDPLLLTELGRWTGMSAVIVTILNTFLFFARERSHSFFARFSKKHTVIIGVGHVGAAFSLNHIHKRNKRLICIDPNRTNPDMEELDNLGALVIYEDGTKPGLYRRIRLERASNIIITTNFDKVNILILNQVKKYLAKYKNDKYENEVFVHLNDPDFMYYLYDDMLAADKNFSLINGRPLISRKTADSYRIHFFNIDELSSRRMFLLFPPDKYKKDASSGAHIVLSGDKEPLEIMTRQLAFIAHYQRDVKTRLTLICSEKIYHCIIKQPGINDIFDIHFIQNEDSNLDVIISEKLQNSLPIDVIYTCFNEESDRLSFISSFLRFIRENSITIVNLAYEIKGLIPDAVIDESKYGSQLKSTVHYFSIEKQVCHMDYLQDLIIEKIGFTIHRYYEKYNGYEPVKRFDDLPYYDRLSNIRAAEHTAVKIRLLCNNDDIISLVRAGDFIGLSDLLRCKINKITKKQKEDLQAIEHQRWMAEKLLQGWKYGIEKSFERKLSPYIVEYDKLSEDVKRYDWIHYEILPDIVKDMGTWPDFMKENIKRILGNNV